MTSTWKLFRDGFAEYRKHWLRYGLITGIVAVPANAIALSSGLSGDATVSFYVELASIFATTGLIWAVVHRHDLVGLGLRRAYYEGSGMIVRLLLAIILLALMTIPLAIGLTFYTLGTSPGSGSTIGVQLLLGGLALVLSLPTLVALVRFGFAAFAIADGDYPVEAMKASRRRSLGRFWFTAGRLVLIFLYLVMLFIPAVIIAYIIALITHWAGVDQLLQLYLSIVILPIGLLSYHKFYRLLEGAKA